MGKKPQDRRLIRTLEPEMDHLIDLLIAEHAGLTFRLQLPQPRHIQDVGRLDDTVALRQTAGRGCGCGALAHRDLLFSRDYCHNAVLVHGCQLPLALISASTFSSTRPAAWQLSRSSFRKSSIAAMITTGVIVVRKK